MPARDLQRTWGTKLQTFRHIAKLLPTSHKYQYPIVVGHEIVGVFTIPDVNGREDPVALAAQADGVPVFKYKRWRLKGKFVFLSIFKN